MDIVEKLRRQSASDEKAGTLYSHTVAAEAADEIERLRKDAAARTADKSQNELVRSIRLVRRPSGRTIPDLTGREHVCEWQRSISKA